MRFSSAALTTLAAGICMTLVETAEARDTFRDPPRAGTEVGVTRPGDPYRVQPGVEASGFMGAGYGVGVGGRLGYAFDSGVYMGGAFTYYTGNASFLGGEFGYKFFPGYRWELRPYIFGGAAFIRVGDSGFGRPAAETVFAFQPGFLGAYHFGPAFLYADLRAYVAPNPGALAALGGFGVSL